MNLRTTSDPIRDQIIGYLDLAAYHYLNHPDGVKKVYFVLIIDTEKPPWILTRYRKGYPAQVFSILPQDTVWWSGTGPVRLIIIMFTFRIDTPNSPPLVIERNKGTWL